MDLVTSLQMGINKTFLLGIFRGVDQGQDMSPGLQFLTPPPQGRCIKVTKPLLDNMLMVMSLNSKMAFMEWGILK